MLSNKRFVPGVLPTSLELSYSATKTAKEMFLYVQYIGHSYVEPKYSVIRREYFHYLLMYVISGRIIFQTNNTTEEAAAGEALLIETARPHIYGSIGNSEILWVHFNGSNFAPLFQHVLTVNGSSHVFNLKATPDFLKKFMELYFSYATHKLYPEMLVSVRLRELIALLTCNEYVSRENLIQKSLQYINAHYSESLSLDFLSRYSGLSISRFCALFKSETGYAPHKYIMNTRLHASRMLLSSSEESIGTIATMVGFSDASSFIAAFRKKYNQTPLQYRTQLDAGN